MNKRYTIQASVKKYALYEVDENGRPTYEYQTYEEAKAQCDLLNSNE